MAFQGKICEGELFGHLAFSVSELVGWFEKDGLVR